MAEIEPPPAKKMCYNSRGSNQLKSHVMNASNGSFNVPHQSVYRLRSGGKINESEIQFIEPPRKRMKPSLLILNPDCLLKLFEYINLVELHSMAETCTTLNTYAKYYFRLKHKNFDFTSMFSGDLLDVDKASTFLNIFGNEIHTLNVSRDLFKNGGKRNYSEDVISTILLQLIANNCRLNLKILTLDGIYFESTIMANYLATLLNSIESLSLDRCYMYDVDWCDMKNLQVLKLHDVEGFCPNFQQVKFDKLEVVEFHHLVIEMESLKKFILSAPTIKRLSNVGG